MGQLYQESQSNIRLISYAKTAEMQPFLSWDIIVLGNIMCMCLWWGKISAFEVREKKRQHKTTQRNSWSISRCSCMGVSPRMWHYGRWLHGKVGSRKVLWSWWEQHRSPRREGMVVVSPQGGLGGVQGKEVVVVRGEALSSLFLLSL